MLIPLWYICVGWCYCHGGGCWNHTRCVQIVLADVKANCGWWNYHWSANYFRLSSEMLSRTSSQMCDRWYLPMFLFRDGLFTLMYKASLIVLKRLWSSLPKMVKLSMVTLWPEMLTWSLSNSKKYCSVLEKIPSIYDNKQNDKTSTDI